MRKPDAGTEAEAEPEAGVRACDVRARTLQDRGGRIPRVMTYPARTLTATELRNEERKLKRKTKEPLYRKRFFLPISNIHKGSGSISGLYWLNRGERNASMFNRMIKSTVVQKFGRRS